MTRLAALLPNQSAEPTNSTPEFERCRVPGCGGTLRHDTDGRGALVSWCEDCERRVRTLALLRGGLPKAPKAPPPPPPPAPRELTDEELLERLDTRFTTLAQLKSELAIGHNALAHAVETGVILSMPVSGRVRLVSRASAQAWRAKFKAGLSSDERIALLPRSSDQALTCRELAKVFGVGLAAAGMWLVKYHRQGQLQRIPVDRGGPVPSFAYWWNESATEARSA